MCFVLTKLTSKPILPLLNMSVWNCVKQLERKISRIVPIVFNEEF